MSAPQKDSAKRFIGQEYVCVKVRQWLDVKHLRQTGRKNIQSERTKLSKSIFGEAENAAHIKRQQKEM